MGGLAVLYNRQLPMINSEQSMSIVDACESRTNITPEFPMGWFSVSRSHELHVGEVKAVQAFDRELFDVGKNSGQGIDVAVDVAEDRKEGIGF